MGQSIWMVKVMKRAYTECVLWNMVLLWHIFSCHVECLCTLIHSLLSLRKLWGSLLTGPIQGKRVSSSETVPFIGTGLFHRPEKMSYSICILRTLKCLAYNECTINICWENEPNQYMDKYNGQMFPVIAFFQHVSLTPCQWTLSSPY